MSETLKEKIINALIRSQNINEEQIQEAIMYQKKHNISLDKALVQQGLIKEKDLLMMLVKELNIPFINLSKYKIDPSFKEIITEKIARQYSIVPLSMLEFTMTVAISDPLDIFAMDDLKNLTGREIDAVMSTSTEIKKAIDNYYGAQEGSLNDLSRDIHLDDIEIISDSQQNDSMDEYLDESETAPIIKMVNLIIKDAIRQRASDIHLEPAEDELRVRFRIDGVLQNILTIPKENQNAVIVRIKILSRLDITSSQAPQDGRFKMKLTNKEVDFRVSLLPTTFGQKIVLRILDKGNLALGLDGVGISEQPLKIMKEAIAKPFGMILITGPTGSGKSTTLYSMINQLNSVDRNIITVEDPVEYQVEGLTQIQAYPEIGLTFAEGLKSILRQSPDVVMVGEIRDAETADIAIKAALTGQLVLSTLHTNDASGALTRLVDMGVEPFLVASSVVMISAQRLCRKICPKCKEKTNLDQKVLDQIDFEFDKNTEFYQGKGCDNCRQTGYHGRMCITETLDVTEEIRTLLLEGKTSDDIKAYSRKHQGMHTLFEDAMLKCVAGLTTMEEVLRVTTSD